MSEHPWLQMASGRPWVLTAPTPEQVHWPDIAESLAKLCRFNGHSTEFYSVAQHCCLVADMLPPQYRLYGLLHDAHEAMIGDLTVPLKTVLENLNAKATFDHLATITDEVIFAAAELQAPMPGYVAAAVKHADLTLLATERRDLMANSDVPWGALPDPLPRRIIPWGWPKAAEEFLKRLFQLLGTFAAASISPFGGSPPTGPPNGIGADQYHPSPNGAKNES